MRVGGQADGEPNSSASRSLAAMKRGHFIAENVWFSADAQEYLRYFLILLASTAFCVGVYGGFIDGWRLKNSLGFVLSLISFIAFALLRRGYVRWAVGTLICSCWAFISIWCFMVMGVRTPAVILYPVLILLSGWLGNRGSTLVMTFATIIILCAMYWAEQNGLLILSTNRSPQVYLIAESVAIVLTGMVAYLVGTGLLHQLTLRDEVELKASFLTSFDPLTKTPNRLLLRDRLDQAIRNTDLTQNKVALLFIDIDNFKTINNSLGQTIGDRLIQELSCRIIAALHETDTVSHCGGDEFLVVLTRLQHTDEIAPILQKLMGVIREGFVIGDHDLSVTASIGVSVYPQDGHDIDGLINKCELAMYRVKESGRNNYQFFDGDMNAEALDHLNICNGLRKALANAEFLLQYQPQIRFSDGAVVGAEALIRWNAPGEGMISPGRFITIAETSGLIVPIGAWVLREACRQAVAFRKVVGPELVMAVNISAVQFERGDIEQSVRAALDESGLPASCLELELTESLLIRDSVRIIGIIERLKRIGVKFSIDDFGTGYSSLTYLKRLRVDKLKIDQSFVRDCTTDVENEAIVRAIIQMAGGLGLSTIAEGIEDIITANRIRELGCDEAQGYFYALPLDPMDFVDFLRKTELGRARVC